MLRLLQIRNLAVIAELELEFGSGMTVFTGETGAGKSILIEALGLALGDRADSTMLRAGCEQASIAAIFSPPEDAEFRRTLEDSGIDWDDELVIKRQFGTDGRSRAFVNGSPVPVQILRALGERLADIHGQHEHQSLLRRDAQRELLDAYAGNEARCENVMSAFEQVRRIEQELARVEGLQGNAEQETELLRYQVAELHAVQPTAEGIARLEEEHRRISNAGRLAEGCRQSLAVLTEEDASAQPLIERASHELHNLAKIDSRFNEVVELLETAHIQLREAEHWLRDYSDRLDADPTRVQQLEVQIAVLHDLARKHRVRPDQLPEQLTQLEQRLAELEHSAERRQQLRQEFGQALSKYQKAAVILHDARVDAGKNLARAVSRNIQELGMAGGRFAIDVKTLGEDTVAVHGTDRVEFLVSANPGQPLKPLSKVASGGELSRISLAIQVLSAQGKGVPTFVFDEVDVGIGGRVAEIVGRMLRELGEKGQVLCVTHLPQVAALGHHHVQIVKTIANGQTHIAVSGLNANGRVDEIARMLGGVTITAQTVAHARALLKQSGV